MYYADERKRKEENTMKDLLKINLQLHADENLGETGEVADPQDTETDDDIGGETDTLEGGGEVAGSTEGEERTSKQDPKIDRAFAQLRREKEEYEKQLKARDEWVKNTFGEYGIETWDDYQKAVEQQLQAMQEQYRQQREQELVNMGIDPQVIREILKNDPEFQQLKQQNEILKQQNEQRELQQQVRQEFNELKEAYPELIKSPADIDDATKERWEKGGVTLLEAFELSNRAKIKESAQQKARNQMKNRSHLKTETDGAGDIADVNIPPETLQMYKDIGMTKEQAMKHYKKLYK